MDVIPLESLQTADKLLGRIACALLQPLRWARALRPRPAEVRRVLLIKFWGLGSLQLMTPAVRALRRRHPKAELVLLTLRQNCAFARGLGVFDEVLPLDVQSRSWLALYLRIAHCVRELRRKRFDRVYDFEFFTRFSAVISLLSGARDSVGYASPNVWRGGLHSRSAPFNRYWHVARNFRCLAGGENGREIGPEELDRFRVEPADEAECEAALERAGIEGGPLVVLNPNAGSLSLERRWPLPYFAEVARKLVEEDDARIALVGGAGEREWTAELAALLADLPQGRVANLAGALSIGSLHALFDRAAAFVSNDSGPMHLAAASGVPTLGLFGPETPVMYGPIGGRARALFRPPACSPCINVHHNKVVSCFRGRPECLMAIQPIEVLDEVRAFLKRDRLHAVPRREVAARVDRPQAVEEASS